MRGVVVTATSDSSSIGTHLLHLCPSWFLTLGPYVIRSLGKAVTTANSLGRSGCATNNSTSRARHELGDLSNATCDTSAIFCLIEPSIGTTTLSSSAHLDTGEPTSANTSRYREWVCDYGSRREHCSDRSETKASVSEAAAPQFCVVVSGSPAPLSGCLDTKLALASPLASLALQRRALASRNELALASLATELRTGACNRPHGLISAHAL